MSCKPFKNYMNLEHYLKHQFIVDLQKLNYQLPNTVIRDHSAAFKIDEHTIFFGGPDWKNLSNDIKQIQPIYYENFFLCLFTIVTIDLTFYTYFQEYYTLFRNQTKYPKFGWTGFGVHYENPRKLLDIPYQLGLFDENKLNYEAYSTLFFDSLSNYLQSLEAPITVENFMDKLINDQAFETNIADERLSNNVISSLVKFQNIHSSKDLM